MIEKCQCGYCGVNIEFEADSFIRSGQTSTKIFGQNVTCPSCHKATILTLQNKTPNLARFPKTDDENKVSHVESQLDNAGIIFLIIGVTGLLGSAYAYFNDGEQWMLILGFVGALQGAISYLLFKGFAEVIRLLRKK